MKKLIVLVLLVNSLLAQSQNNCEILKIRGKTMADTAKVFERLSREFGKESDIYNSLICIIRSDSLNIISCEMAVLYVACINTTDPVLLNVGKAFKDLLPAYKNDFLAHKRALNEYLKRKS